jgi:glycosyltransferase involved in cell wall biosynthesis
MTNKIKVSIMMITKNRADLLPFAIDSILQQTFTDWELLIIDNGSVDQTKDVVAGYIARDARIKYFESDLTGTSPNRNLALRLARGEYVSVLDSDDVWLEPDKLTAQIAFLDSHQDYGVVGSQASLIDIAGQIIGSQTMPETDEAIRASLTRRDNLIHSSAFYRRAMAVSVGGYDETLLIGEDWDLWLKLGLRGKLANLPQRFIGYRVHQGNMGYGRLKKVLFTGHQIVKRYFKSYPNAWLNRLKWLYAIAKSNFKPNDTLE